MAGARDWVTLMHEAVYWVGFLGAWFLFAGPVYQSALELGEQREIRERMERAMAGSPPSRRVSAWWWLLPPVAIYLILRSRGEQWDVVDGAMTDDDREAVSHYKAVARGWWFVGAGAWLIFLKEAYELAEHREWSMAGYWVVVVLMTLLATGSAGSRGERAGRRRGPRAA